MPHQVTVTAKTGPDRQITGLVIPNVQGLDFQLDSKRLFIQTDTASGDNIKEFELTSVATVTVAITAGNWAVTIA